MILDHPFGTATAKDGSFEISGVPFGRHEFRLWHERIGYIQKTIEVEVDAPKVSLPQIVLTAARLREVDERKRRPRP